MIYLDIITKVIAGFAFILAFGVMGGMDYATASGDYETAQNYGLLIACVIVICLCIAYFMWRRKGAKVKKMAAEKAFETKVKAFLKAENCWVLKTWSNGVQRSGVPDLLICCNGYFLGVELKAENGKPSDLQLWNVKKIREAGGISIVLYPNQYKAFQDLIHYIKNIHTTTNIPAIIFETQFRFTEN